MSVTVKIQGVEAIQQLLVGLDESLKHRILIRALNRTAKPILSAAEKNVWTAQRSGRLYRSLGIKQTKIRGYAIPMITIGARTGGKFKGYHAHWIEDGTKQRFRKTKSGKKVSTGSVSGLRFWSRALESNSSTIDREMQQNIIRGIQLEVNRMSRKS